MKLRLNPLVAAGLVMAVVGCGAGSQESDAKPSGSDGRERKPSQVGKSVAGQKDSNAGAVSRSTTSDGDRWSLILLRLNNAESEMPSKLGFSRFSRREVNNGGSPLIQQTLRLEMSTRRSGAITSQWHQYTSYETTDGKLLRFETMQSMGRGTRLSTGRVEGDKLKVEVVVTAVGGAAPKVENTSMPWQDRFGSFFAVENSLRGQPLKPGEKRSIKYLDPATNILTETSLEAFDYEQVGLLQTSQRALHARRTETIGKTQLTSHFWCDEKGEILKARFEGTGMEQYLTSQAVATGPWKAPQIDFVKAMTIPVREIPNPHDTKEVVYRVRVKAQKDAAELFPNCLSQRVKSQGDGSARIVVRQLRPDSDSEGPPGRQPKKEDTEANGLIQSDDAAIQALATELTGQVKDDWKAACLLEKHVFELIEKKTMTQAFATAAEVLRTAEGDCTEHAVLLAALCRARKIPARVAIGLVYFVSGAERRPRMAYHMWTEVYVARRWIPLDATLGRGGIGGGHLKVADSSLAGTTGFSAMLPLLHVANQLDLEVESFR